MHTDANTGADSASGQTSSEAHAPTLSDQMNREIEAAMDELAAESGFAGQGAGQRRAIRGPRVVQAGREHRTGNVVSVGPTDIFVEFGPKELGVVERAGWPEDKLPKVGEPLELVVTRFDPNEGIFVCARPGAVQKADWEMLETGQDVEARVVGVNKGGLELEVAGHRAFMPAGQVSYDHVKDLSVFIGEKMVCRVQKLDRRGKGNIVLSRRDVLAKERAAKAAVLRETLAEGMVVEGTVRKIMPFGAFVDLGGVDGLIHLSDLTHDRIGHGERAIAKHVSEGQHLRVQILKLDWENDRISLGLKQLEADPFAAAATAIEEGAEVTGKVTKILEFGCFVEVAPGVEGLVHISELDWKRVNKVDDVVRQDEVICVRVLKIDQGGRKISLSLKATKPQPEREQSSRGGKGRADHDPRTPEQILEESPALRRLRAKFKQGGGLKGGLS
ncbi:MAG: S1 RNA-binding domain-containing protein [Phycisphaeraceae bacterium]|nr:S1 RNA-binding domain-containing protein [Phycisphaeraceae bacterium]MCW5762424.1 S1 RNA-binding domain-containing protein [Phycisphaeraceae bacterium]